MTFVAERHAREERQAAFEGTKPLLEKLNSGERLSVEERADLAARHARVDELNKEIRDYEAARELAATAAPSASSAPGASVRDGETPADAEFRDYLKTGATGPELRAAGIASGSAGGYTVPPGWWQRLQVALKVYGGIANDFEQISTASGQPMNWATVDPTTIVGQLVGAQTSPPALLASSSPNNTNENSQIQDVDYTFGQGVLGAYMFTSGVQKISYQLANDDAFDLDAFVTARVGEALGRAYAQYAVSGSGSNAPLGIVTALAAATGLTSGGVLTLGTGTEIATLDGVAGTGSTELIKNALSFRSVLNVIHSIDPAYRSLGAKWYFNDTMALNQMAVTDNYGRPLWTPDPQVGEPDRLYGFPTVIDNNLPSLAASTVGGPIFGHLPSAMVQRTVQGTTLMRLNERYADFLQVGYIGHSRMDMRSNDLRAAVVVKAAAS